MAKSSAPPGYSAKSLRDKLGLNDDMHALIINPPDEYLNWIGKFKSNDSPDEGWDFVHLFTNKITALESRLYELRHKIKPDGMIWISWYKKSAGLPTEIVEDVIRDTALPLGYVDVKVCAVSESWSGLKLVIRKELR